MKIALLKIDIESRYTECEDHTYYDAVAKSISNWWECTLEQFTLLNNYYNKNNGYLIIQDVTDDIPKHLEDALKIAKEKQLEIEKDEKIWKEKQKKETGKIC